MTTRPRASSARLPSRLGSRASTIVGLTVASLVAGTCGKADSQPMPAARPVEAAPSKREVVEVIYDGALAKDWNDWGWSPRELGKGAARINMTGYGGWILARPGLSRSFGALVFRLQAPAMYGDFLEVSIASDTKSVYPRVKVKAEHRAPRADGSVDVTIPMAQLNPDRLPFDRVVFWAGKQVGTAWVSIDKVGLTEAEPRDAALDVGPVKDVALSVDCRAVPLPISPLIYGIAYNPQSDATAAHTRALGATARRWGGNPSSRYNWELGSAWNTGHDWFFENVNFGGTPGKRYAEFLDDALARGLKAALTVPILGWVAKDTASYSFPVAELGPQRAVDPYKPDAGDGYSSNGKPIPAGSPTRTSVPAPPAMIKRWVEAIRAEDQRRGARSVHMYILDNEPMLWNSTHRDVHPEPVTYDELLDRTIRYGAAVREADPGAVIAGPALWGWPAYFFSAKDAAAGFRIKPDRLAHGDVPLLPWYLGKLREHEQRTGTRILDIVDVHFYPQAEGVFGEKGGIDAATSARRLRSTRALWDPSYKDESWIDDAVELIPRLNRWIAESYPGLGVSIGEYNFGAEGHISGGLALAEALGRFGQGGVTSAFYWTYPPEGSPAFWAFRAYRDFDGKGGRFLDFSLPAKAPEGASIFASRDGSGTRLVAVILNMNPKNPIRPALTLRACGKVTSKRVFQYAGGAGALAPVKEGTGESTVAATPLPPSSITVLDLAIESKP